MKKFLFLCLLLFLIPTGCSKSVRKADSGGNKPLIYEINLNERADDLFKVTLRVDDLTEKNAIYQFAATAPGTYQVMDIGRFVRSFSAFDKSGNELITKQISTNQWQIEQPALVHEIRYSIAETWDTPVDSNRVYPMAGSSIEDDHVQLMGHCVFGYPTGMQTRPLSIKLIYPKSWETGTALRHDKNGAYFADNYDHIVDSPILLGRLSKAELKIKGSRIEIYTYSATDKVKSADILDSVKEILQSAAKFMNGLPVDRYTFLFHFEDVTFGAWEHSYSSNYILSEESFDRQKDTSIPAMVAHEFFHVVTPLNIHSEIIEQFNFVEPVPSEHLWLYEGATEWAAHIMQLRSGLIQLDNYLNRLTGKLKTDDHFNKSMSLKELALQAYSPDGQQQYANIYMRGAIVAGLLDIRLLELSQGKRGLREVINQLSRIYGPTRAFSENGFYDALTQITYPEIAHFFDNYVKRANPLPVSEYYAKIGLKHFPEIRTGEDKATSGFKIVLGADEKFIVAGVDEEAKKFGVLEGDAIVGFNGQTVNLKNIGPLFAQLKKLEAGIPYELTVERANATLNLTCEKINKEEIKRHVLEIDADATPEQIKLRESWMRNI